MVHAIRCFKHKFLCEVHLWPSEPRNENIATCNRIREQMVTKMVRAWKMAGPVFQPLSEESQTLILFTHFEQRWLNTFHDQIQFLCDWFGGGL